MRAVSDQWGAPSQAVVLSLLSGSDRVKRAILDKKTPQISSLCLGCPGWPGSSVDFILYDACGAVRCVAVLITPKPYISSITSKNIDNLDNLDRARKSAGFSCLGGPVLPCQTQTDRLVRLARDLIAQSLSHGRCGRRPYLSLNRHPPLAGAGGARPQRNKERLGPGHV
jgi:hypothetical protein